MENNEVNKLYKTLISKGYSPYNIGDEDTFASKMADRDNRKQLYDWVSSRGDVNIGDYNSYEKLYSGVKDNLQEASSAPDGAVRPYASVQSDEPAAPTVRQNRPDTPLLDKKAEDVLKPVDNTVRQDNTSVAAPVLPTAKFDDAYKRGVEERIIDSHYVQPKAEKVEDVARNYIERFRQTENGQQLGDELEEKRKEVSEAYASEFLKSPEYKALTKQYSGDRLNTKANELFKDKYSGAIDRAMQPYEENFVKAAYDRYGNNIQKEEQVFVKKGVAERVAEMDKDIDTQLDEVRKRLRSYAGQGGNAGNALMGSASYNRDTSEDRHQEYLLETAKKMNGKSLRMIDEASKKDGWINAISRGVRDEVLDFDNWLLGIADYAKNVNLEKIAEKADKGETLSKAEQALMDACLNNLATQSYYSSDLSRAYRAGQTTGASLPFMLEFVVNPLSASGSAIARGMLKYGLKKFGKKVSKMAARLVGDAAAAAGMTMTTGLGRVASGYKERRMGDFVYDIDNNGAIQYKGRENQQGAGEALGRSFANTFLEDQSEMIFNAFKGAGGVLLGQLEKWRPGFTKQIKNMKVADWYNRVYSNKTFRDIAERTQFHGLPEEYMEEVYNNFANVAIGEMDLKDATDLDNNIDTFLGLAPTTVAMSMIGLGGLAHQRVKSNLKGRKIERQFVDQLGEEEFERLSSLKDNKEIGDYIKGVIRSEEYTTEEKKLIIEAAYLQAEKKAQEEGREQQTPEQNAADDAFVEGAEQDHQGNYATELSREALGNRLDAGVRGSIDTMVEDGATAAEVENLLSGLDGESAKVARSYYHALMAEEGAIENARVTVDNNMREFESSLIPLTDKSGNVTTATYKDDVVFVRSEHGDNAIIQYEDGHIEAVLTKNLKEKTATPASDLITEQREKITAQAQEALQNRFNLHPNTRIPYQGMEIWNGDTPYIISEVRNNADGTQTIVAYPARLNAETGKMEMKSGSAPIEMTYDEALQLQNDYYNRMDAANSQQADAQAEQPQVDNMSENKPQNEGASSDGESTVSNRDANTLSNGEQQEEQKPKLVTKRDGTPDFIASGEDASMAFLQDKYKEKTGHKIEVTKKATAEKLKKAESALFKAQQAYDDAPIGAEDKAEATLNKAKEAYDAARKEADFWNVMGKKVEADANKIAKEEIRSASEVQNDNSAVASDGLQSEPVADNGSTSNGTPSKLEDIVRPEPTIGSNASTNTAEVVNSPAKAAKGEAVDRGGNSSQPISSENKDSEAINNRQEADIKKDGTEQYVGRSLTESEANELLSRMEEEAEISTEQELTAEAWNKTFDKNNSIETPIGRVKMGGNQITKFFEKNREKEFGMVAPTLRNPDVIIEEKSEAKDGETERPSSYLFVKTFNRNGEKVKFYASITVQQDGMEVSISSHYINKNRVGRAMKEGKVLYTREALLPNSSEWHLAEHQSDVPDLLPTQGNNASSENKDSEVVDNKQETEEKIAKAEAETNTNPTEAQKESGNYKKGHVRIDGHDITIEQPKGSVRRGKDQDGKDWETEMHNTYGYIRGTEGVDGDHIDVFLSDNPTEGNVYVVDQVNPETGEFDEHKVMYGFDSAEEAKAAYLSNYEKGWKGLGNITEVSKEEFKKWIDSSKRKTKPFAEYKGVKRAETNTEVAQQQLPLLDAPVDINEWMRQHPGQTPTTADLFNESQSQKQLGKELSRESNTTDKGVTLTKINYEGGYVLEARHGSDFVKQAYYPNDEVMTNPKVAISVDAEAFKKYVHFDENGLAYMKQGEILSSFMNAVESDKKNETARQQKAGKAEQLTPAETALRDAVIDRLRENGMEVITDVEEGQRVLEMANGEVRTHAMLSSLAKAANTIRGWLAGNKRGYSFSIELPESTRSMIRKVMGRDFDSHVITANNVAHAYKNHGMDGAKITDKSIPLTKEDMELMPYIMVAPDYVHKGSEDATGRESVRFYKTLGNGYVVVVEKEQKNSPHDMETITMWAEKSSSNVADARTSTSPAIDARNVIISTEDAAKIRKDAETAITNDEKVREQRVYHGSGADFNAFDHSHMGEGEGNQAFGWGTYVTKVEGIGRKYADIAFFNAEQRREERDETPLGKAVDAIVSQEKYNSTVSNFEQRKAVAIENLERIISTNKKNLTKEKGNEIISFLRESIESDKAELEAVRTLTEEQYNEERIKQGRVRHLYTVEIPEDTGENYLDWDKPLTDELIDKIAKALPALRSSDIGILKKGKGEDLYNMISMRIVDDDSQFNDDKATSKFLSSLGFVGVKYPADYFNGGNEDGKHNYVIFNEADAKITDHVRFFRTPSGEAYGYTVGNRIYIDPRIANTETPIHEYAHLWATALRKGNEKEWRNVVELMKGTPLWEEVEKKYPELTTEDEIADEVLAHYSGRRGAERLREEQRKALENKDVMEAATAVSAINKVRRALRAFWKGVADFLHLHYTTAEEVADRVMKDLLDGVNPIKVSTQEKAERIKKLRDSSPIEITGKEITSDEDFKVYKKNALEYGKKLQGEYVNKDTGEAISLQRGRKNGGINEVLQHNYKDVEHLQSIAAIPQIIENSIYISSDENRDKAKNPNVSEYQHYVCGLKIGDKDYTVHSIVAVDNQGNRYYDHNLTHIEKGKLLDLIDKGEAVPRKGFGTTPDNKSTTNSEYKYNQLVSILQADSENLDGIRFQFIGEKGAEAADRADEVNTRLDNLSVAREMEADKKDAKAIKMATGWERGADGKWRYEIPDIKYHPKGDAEFNKLRDKQPWSKELDKLEDKLFDGEELTESETKHFDELAELDNKFKAEFLSREKNSLADWVESKELFAAYPELKNVGIVFTDQLSQEEGGYYSEREKQIVVNTSSIIDTESVIAHEIQHAIQRIEGFARGGNTKDTKLLFEKAKEEWKARAWAHELSETAKEDEYESQLEVEKALLDEYRQMDMEEYIPDNETRIKGFNYFARGYADRSLDDAIKQFRLDQSTRADFNDYREYQRIAGEVEARNVQIRMGMSAEERRRSLAAETEDVAREDQLFLNGSSRKLSESEDTRFRSEESAELEEANEKFNQELEDFTMETADKFYFNLGKPSNELLSAGVENKPIRLHGSKVAKKMRKHGFQSSELKDLPKAIAHPIAVFDNLGRTGNRSILTELKTANGNFLVTIDLGKGMEADFDIVSSVFGKQRSSVLEWINKGMMKYVDKEKALNYLHLSAPIAEALDNSKLSSATKIVETFENPSVELEEINEKFNEELEQQIDGKLPNGHIYKMGNPGKVLLSTGIPNLPIQMNAKRLQDKATMFDHDFDLGEVKNLVKALQEPLAVFAYGNKAKAQNIIVPLQKDGKNFIVGLSLNPTVGGRSLEINSIRNVFPKDNSEWLNWVNQGKTLFLDKEKIQTLINQQRTNLADVDYLDLDSIANVIETFENPSVELEEINEKFNQELEDFKQGMHKGNLSLGMPQGKLSLVGLNANEMFITPKTLKEHMEKHGISVEDLKDLPKELANPMLVYEWGKKAKSMIVITNMSLLDGRKITAAIKLERNGEKIEVNELASIHGKAIERFMSDMENAKDGGLEAALKYVDKEKALDWLGLVPPKGTASLTDQELSIANVIETFENPSVADEKVSETNAPASIEDEVDHLQKIFHTPVRIVHNDTELTEDERKTVENRKRAAERRGMIPNIKGWFDPKTGEVVIYMPGTESVEDARKTFLHEVVGHKGLRELFGAEEYDRKMTELLDRLPEEEQEKVKAAADAKYKGDMSVAMDEYLAEQAEKDELPSWWGRVVSAIRDMLHKLGFDMKLTNNDVRYLLWRSRNKLRETDLLDAAEDMTNRKKWGIGGEEKRFRDISMVGEPSLYVTERNVGAARDMYERMVSETSFKLQESYQDSMLGLKKMMEAIEKATGSRILDYENPYMAENALSSKNFAEMEAYRQLVYKPILQEVKKLMDAGVAYDDIVNYLYAKHGLERNEYMARQEAQEKFDADPNSGKTLQDFIDECREKDYSGLTALTGKEKNAEAEAEAKNMVDGMESAHNTDALWKTINASTSATLSKMHESGLIDKETYDNIKGMYKYYIPLRGWEDTTAAEEYDYLNSSHSNFSNPLIKAKGRKSKADDPIATIGNNAESAIVRGNRNLMKQKFLTMVQNHRTDLASVSDLWMEKRTAIDANGKKSEEWVAVFPDIPDDATPQQVNAIVEQFNKDMQARKDAGEEVARRKDKPNVPYRLSPREQSEHQVVVYRGGKPYIVTVNANPRAAQAMNGATNPDAERNVILQALGKANRFMSANFTARNPGFIAANFVRDGIYANSIVRIKESSDYANDYHKEWIDTARRMSGLLKRYENGTLDMNNTTDRLFSEFIKNGGETGYTFVNSVEDYKGTIAKELKRMNSKSRQAWGKLADTMDHYGRMAEDVSRFAAYVTSRKHGRSIDRSVNDAKEISVNFNKKGSGSKMVGKNGNALVKILLTVSQFGRSGYIFWNAGVQGLTNFIRLAKNHKTAFAKMAGSFFGMGFALPMLSAAFGGDDDDYYNLPEYTRRQNICFKVPGTKEYVTIPLPVELRAIYGLGELCASVALGKEDFSTKKVLEQVSQIFPIDVMGEEGFAAFAPSYAKPIWEVHTNQSWTGLPIYKKNDFNKDMPEWTKAYKSTSPTLVELFRIANEMTGGNKYKSGFIDFNPAMVEHLVSGYLGGVGTTITQLAHGVEAIWNEDMRTVRNIPIASRFFREADERAEEKRIDEVYFDNKARFDKIGRQERGFRKEMKESYRDPMEYAEWRKKYNDLIKTDKYKKYLQFKAQDKALKKWQDAYNLTGDEETERRIFEMKAEMNRMAK